MPNWVENKVCIKGKAEDLLAFINLGLKNSLVGELNAEGDAQKYLEDALNLLKAEGIFYTTSGDVFSKSPKKVVAHKGVCFSTFFPIPETYFKYDTTNHKDDFPDAANEQLEKYGAIGWYDYNLKSFGCKWDCQLNNLRIAKNGDNEFILKFECETPWSVPEVFLCRVSEKFSGLSVYDCYVEEMYEDCGYFKVGGKDVDWTSRFCQIGESSEDCDDDYCDNIDVIYDEMMYDYDSFVLSSNS